MGRQKVTQMNEGSQSVFVKGSALRRHLLVLRSAVLFSVCVCSRLGLCGLSCECFLLCWLSWIGPERQIQNKSASCVIILLKDHEKKKVTDLHLMPFGDWFSSCFSWSVGLGLLSDSETSFSFSDSPFTGLESSGRKAQRTSMFLNSFDYCM